eukprot:m.163995 g.163995  ORF g.163995 m.163995 type:complete len:213 (+) comp15224_c0_seq1:1219-1857(+)
MDLSLSFTCFLALLVETSSLYNSYGWWIPIRHHVVTYKEYQTDFERSYFYEQGRRLIDSHNCDEGISLLRTGVDLAPKDAAARNNLAVGLLRCGNHALALEVASQAVQLAGKQGNRLVWYTHSDVRLTERAYASSTTGKHTDLLWCTDDDNLIKKLLKNVNSCRETFAAGLCGDILENYENQKHPPSQSWMVHRKIRSVCRRSCGLCRGGQY